MLGERIVGRFVRRFLAKACPIRRRHSKPASELQQLLDRFVEHPHLGHLPAVSFFRFECPVARLRQFLGELAIAAEAIPEHVQQDAVGLSQCSKLAGTLAKFLESKVCKIVNKISRRCRA